MSQSGDSCHTVIVKFMKRACLCGHSSCGAGRLIVGEAKLIQDGDALDLDRTARELELEEDDQLEVVGG